MAVHLREGIRNIRAEPGPDKGIKKNRLVEDEREREKCCGLVSPLIVIRETVL